MSLPSSRDFDAVDGGPLPAATVNNLQDAIVIAKHGDIVDLVAHEGGQRTADVVIETGNYYFWIMPANATARMRIPLRMRAGDRIKEFAVYVRDIAPGSAGDGFAIRLGESNPSAGGTFTAKSSTVQSARSGADQAVGEVLAAPYTVLDNRPVQIDIIPDGAGDLGGGNMRIYPYVRVVYDRP